MNAEEIMREPIYPIAHAAHYLNLNPATLSTWVKGRTYPTSGYEKFSKPLIALEPGSRGLLSFQNLVEAHVLKAIRRKYLIQMREVRRALDYVSKKLNTKHPLATANFSVNGKSLFVEHLGSKIDLTDTDQLHLWEALQVQFDRIDRDEDGIAKKLYPITREKHKIIVINPRISQGRPIIESLGVSTDIIFERWKAGDTYEVLKGDYGLDRDQLDEAIWYEQHEQQLAA